MRLGGWRSRGKDKLVGMELPFENWMETEPIDQETLGHSREIEQEVLDILDAPVAR